MWKKLELRLYVPYALIAAFIYNIPVYFFIREAMYRDAWLLYLGNFLFALSITIFIFSFRRIAAKTKSLASKFAAGHIATLIGIVFSCLIATALILIMIPGLFSRGDAKVTLGGAPANMVLDKTEGLNFMIYANAIIGNLIMGMFVSIIFPFSIRSNPNPPKHVEG